MSIIRVRMTPVERSHLTAVAREMGLSLSTYARRALLGRPLPPRRLAQPIPEVNRLAYVELSRIGRNLNQIAHRLNGGEGPKRGEVMAVFELLAAAIGEVRVQLLGLDEPFDSEEERR